MHALARRCIAVSYWTSAALRAMLVPWIEREAEEGDGDASWHCIRVLDCGTLTLARVIGRPFEPALIVLSPDQPLLFALSK
jgi:hypothetical protein